MTDLDAVPRLKRREGVQILLGHERASSYYGTRGSPQHSTQLIVHDRVKERGQTLQELLQACISARDGGPPEALFRDAPQYSTICLIQ